jgi:CheY-like chemotaxis protein
VLSCGVTFVLTEPIAISQKGAPFVMKILVVDDNPSYLQVTVDLLRDQGFDVMKAEDGKQARECLEVEQVDVIISDVFMPTLDGSRFHSYVREFMEATDIPFIFVSGYDDDVTKRLVKGSDKDFFFSKTAPFEDIISLLEKLSKKRQADLAR